MPVNTLFVGAAVTPTVIHTYLSHYLNRRPLAQKPTAHISYHEGLELIRRFLHYASFHTVEELQAFTSQWVPVPHWVHVKEVEIPSRQLQRSAEYITAQLGPRGIEAVGGRTWWQWRRDDTPLKAEWIEMRKDYDARRQLNIDKGDRIMLYVHGGAYFFGSVDEHRYQLQRHARKLKARVLAPKYRLAPQFPFPCGLYDCLAAYLYLLAEKHHPNTIILAGDSAGGGMVLSLLVTLRDQGIPLPAGAILISPWVDLTHSFPSLGGDGKMDYIPAHGFIHKPSISWPPPNADDLLEYERRSHSSKRRKTKSPRVSTSKDKKEQQEAEKEAEAERVRGYSVNSSEQSGANQLVNPSATGADVDTWISQDGKYSIGPKGVLSVQLDDDLRVEIKDQIQLYAANHLLTHPLVSPVLQPTLGGLPPLLIQTGGAELLRDEQVYLAHKAAQPLGYLPPPSNNQSAEDIQAQASKYRPTNVQLQVWDDLCHVGPTLSFTRPAKHMYRSIAQFGAWALARAQKKTIDILDDDEISFVSSDSSPSEDTRKVDSSSSLDDAKTPKPKERMKVGSVDPKKQGDVKVGRAGDPLPPFEHHMIRQCVDRHGRIYPLPLKEELEALNLPSIEIGVPKTGPVGKWMKAQEHWNSKFAKQKIKIQKQRVKDIEKGFEGFEGEAPPPTALAGRRVKGMKAEKAKKKSWGMAMWSGWGSKHDKATIVREEKADQVEPSKSVEESTPVAEDGVEKKSQPKRKSSGLIAPDGNRRARSHSHHSGVTDQGQASTDDLSRTVPTLPERKVSPLPSLRSELSSPGLSPPGIIVSENPQSPATFIPATDTLSTRPTKGGIAYPFSLRIEGAEGKDVNASTLTLQSVDIKTPAAVDETQMEKQISVDFEKAAEKLERKEETEKETGTDMEKEAVAQKDRPGMERYFTAPGAGLFSSGLEDEKTDEAEKVERPPVERFETALEDLNTLAKKA